MSSEFTNGSPHFDDLDPHEVQKPTSLNNVRERFKVDSAYKPAYTINYRAHTRPSDPSVERNERRIEANRIRYEVKRRLLIDHERSLENALRALDKELDDLREQLEQLHRDKDAILQLTGQEIDQMLADLNLKIQNVSQQLENRKAQYSSEKASIIRSLYNTRDQLQTIEENKPFGIVPSSLSREEAITGEVKRLQGIVALDSERKEIEKQEQKERVTKNKEALKKIQEKMEELNNRIITLQEKLQSQRYEEELIAKGPEMDKNEALRRLETAIRQTEEEIRQISKRMRKYREKEEELL